MIYAYNTIIIKKYQNKMKFQDKEIYKNKKIIEIKLNNL